MDQDALRTAVERAAATAVENSIAELRATLSRTLALDLHRSVEQAIARSLESMRASIVVSVTSSLEDRAALVISGHQDALYRHVVESVVSELQSQLPSGAGGASVHQLNEATSAVQRATSQTEILTAFLTGAAQFSGRCGVFVLRAGRVTGWQARGLDAERFRTVNIDASQGLAEQAIRTRAAVIGSPYRFDQQFADTFGPASDGNALLLPLEVRDRVAALLYADGGVEAGTALNVPALETLVRVTALWLEAVSTRKAQDSAGTRPATGTMQIPTGTMPVPTMPTTGTMPVPPSATPSGAMPAVSAPEPPVSAPQPVPEQAQASSAPTPSASMPAVTPTATGPTFTPAFSGGADDIHVKAKRFAKLLVEEIKLYNQQKVNEGRQSHNVYDLLREDIEKSRAAYSKRFARAVADSDYFNAELVRILADNDVAVMGPAFPGR